jgi:hypothetical protein
MSPAESAFLTQWAQPPPFAPPPTAVLVAGVLLVAILVAALWIAGARAAAAPPAEGDLGPSTPPRPGRETLDGAAEATTVRLRVPDLGSDALRALAVARLRRFVQVAGDPAHDRDAAGRKLARWAVFSAYRDCVALGLDEEARTVLRTGDPGSTTPQRSPPVASRRGAGEASRSRAVARPHRGPRRRLGGRAQAVAPRAAGCQPASAQRREVLRTVATGRPLRDRATGRAAVRPRAVNPQQNVADVHRTTPSTRSSPRAR